MWTLPQRHQRHQSCNRWRTRNTAPVKMPVGSDPSPAFLGIEGGGTRTVALLADASGRLRQRVETGPANLRLLTDAQLRRQLRGLARHFPHPAAVGIGMAGAREASDRRRIRAAAALAWPGVPCWAGNDLDTALAAAELDAPDAAPVTRVVMISGTGSCSFGCNARGRTAKVGGWGHLLGDRGSGYDVALRALRAVVHAADTSGNWPKLGARLLRALQLNEPNELVTWLNASAKADVAALATEVFAAAGDGDPLAKSLVAETAAVLADDATACARRLTRLGGPVEFIFTGGVLRQQPGFARRLANELRGRWPGATARTLEHEGAWGAVRLAQTAVGLEPAQRIGSPAAPSPETPSPGLPDSRIHRPLAHRAAQPALARPGRALDRVGGRVDAGRRCSDSDSIARGAQEHHPRRAARGRCPATWRPVVLRGRRHQRATGRAGRQRMSAHIPHPARAGPGDHRGRPDRALAIGRGRRRRSPGRRARGGVPRCRPAQRRGGHRGQRPTPFVWGALLAAKRHGAKTVLLGCNPHLRFAPGTRPTVVIAPDVGGRFLPARRDSRRARPPSWS